MDIELVADGLFFPEGPIAMADGSVILVEIGGQRVTRVRPDGSKETVAEVGGGPNGAAVGPGYEHIPFPDPITTNICFGGEDMRDAWVTCSSTGKLYKCRWPRPGMRLAFAA